MTLPPGLEMATRWVAHLLRWVWMEYLMTYGSINIGSRDWEWGDTFWPSSATTSRMPSEKKWPTQTMADWMMRLWWIFIVNMLLTLQSWVSMEEETPSRCWQPKTKSWPMCSWSRIRASASWPWSGCMASAWVAWRPDSSRTYLPVNIGRGSTICTGTTVQYSCAQTSSNTRAESTFVSQFAHATWHDGSGIWRRCTFRLQAVKRAAFCVIHTYTHTYIHTYTHTHIHTYIVHVYVYAYVSIYIYV